MTDSRRQQKDSPMGSSPRADSARPRSQPVYPNHHAGAWEERPTTMAGPSTQVSAQVSAQRPRYAPPPALEVAAPSIRRLTLRQRLVGQRSLVFIGIMLARMIWLVVQNIRDGKDLRFAAA